MKEQICRKGHIRIPFHDTYSVSPNSIFNNASGPSIMKSKVIYAFSILKNRKAQGKDNIHAELLKLVNITKLC